MNWKLLLIGLIAILSFQGQAQEFRMLTPKSPKAERILTSCLENTVVVVEQYYNLKGVSGQLYGRDSAQYYGHYVTTGIWVDSFLVLPPEFAAPWQLDSSYINEYADVDSLSPVKSHTLMFTASKGTADTLALRFEDSLSMEEMQFVIFQDTLMHQDRVGLPYEVSEEEKPVEPFFVLAYTDSLAADSLKFKLELHFSATIKSDPSSSIENLLSAPQTQGLIGGYYIWPVITNHRIQLYFRGFLNKSGRLFELHPLQLVDSTGPPSGTGLNPINQN